MILAHAVTADELAALSREDAERGRGIYPYLDQALDRRLCRGEERLEWRRWLRAEPSQLDLALVALDLLVILDLLALGSPCRVFDVPTLVFRAIFFLECIFIFPDRPECRLVCGGFSSAGISNRGEEQ